MATCWMSGAGVGDVVAVAVAVAEAGGVSEGVAVAERDVDPPQPATVRSSAVAARARDPCQVNTHPMVGTSTTVTVKGGGAGRSSAHRPPGRDLGQIPSALRIVLMSVRQVPRSCRAVTTDWRAETRVGWFPG